MIPDPRTDETSSAAGKGTLDVLALHNGKWRKHSLPFKATADGEWACAMMNNGWLPFTKIKVEEHVIHDATIFYKEGDGGTTFLVDINDDCHIFDVYCEHYGDLLDLLALLRPWKVA